MKSLYKFLLLVPIVSMPGLVSAQGFRGMSLMEILNFGTELISTRILVLLVAVGLVLFILGVINMMRSADSPLEKNRWKNILIWGIIALFLMFSIIGILAVLTRSTFGGNPILPQLPESQQNQ